MKDSLGAVQSILLVGGTSEIGLASVRELVALRSARVVLAGRDLDALRLQAQSLHQAGASAVDVVAFDAQDTSSHSTFVDRVWTVLGDIDVAILAFGILGDQLKAEHEVDHALDIVNTNYVGAVSLGVPLAARLREQGHGTIVVLSSVAAERPRRANFVYGSSKAGLDAFFQGLGDSLVGTGAQVLVVRPGFVHGRMTAGKDPAPLATTPEAVGAAVAKALARGDETIWVPSALRFVMAVVRHLPRPVFRRLKA